MTLNGAIIYLLFDYAPLYFANMTTIEWGDDLRPPLDAVRKYAISSTLTVPKNDLFGAYMIAGPLLLHYFGTEWFDRNVMPKLSKPGFLKTGPRDTLEGHVHMWRLIELAELLYNCASMPGFASLVRRFRTEKEIESAVAELRVARCLIQSGVSFQFVVPSGKKGADYDLEIEIGVNSSAPADTKAKVEASKLTDSSVRSALKVARSRNLPKKRPGVVFLHVTQHWVVGSTTIADGRDPVALAKLSEAWINTCDRVVPEFLRTTSRIAAVFVLGAPIIDFGLTMQIFTIKKYLSRTHAQQGFPANLIRYGDLGFVPKPWINFYEEGKPSLFVFLQRHDAPN